MILTYNIIKYMYYIISNESEIQHTLSNAMYWMVLHEI